MDFLIYLLSDITVWMLVIFVAIVYTYFLRKEKSNNDSVKENIAWQEKEPDVAQLSKGDTTLEKYIQEEDEQEDLLSSFTHSQTDKKISDAIQKEYIEKGYLDLNNSTAIDGTMLYCFNKRA